MVPDIEGGKELRTLTIIFVCVGLVVTVLLGAVMLHQTIQYGKTLNSAPLKSILGLHLLRGSIVYVVLGVLYLVIRYMIKKYT